MFQPTPLSTGSARLTKPAFNSPTLRAAPLTPPSAGFTREVTQKQLQKIIPHLSEAKAREYLPHLNSAMAKAQINTPRRQAAFLAQLAHESSELRDMEERASGAQYEKRIDLGNTQRGDGKRYKGRGPIQLTGRTNYQAASRALGMDLENDPQSVARPEVGFRTSGWFWQNKGLNELADKGEFQRITRRVNGGEKGAASRNEYYRKALEVLR